MNKICLALCILIFAFTPSLFAESRTERNPAIENETVTMRELLSFLDIDMFKYRLYLNKGNEIIIGFKDIKRNLFVFKHQVTIENYDHYTLWLSFTKNEGFPSDPLSQTNEKINYSLNWNYEKVFSGTIRNPLYGYDSVYSDSGYWDVGENLEDKTSLIAFYSWDEKSDKEELIAEVYIEFKPK